MMVLVISLMVGYFSSVRSRGDKNFGLKNSLSIFSFGI